MKQKRIESKTEDSSVITPFLKKIGDENWEPREDELSEVARLLEEAKDDEKCQESVKKVELKVLTNLLVAYRATCCDIDNFIFSILMSLEKYGADLSVLHPLAFGESARKNYENLLKMGKSLHVRVTPDEAISTFLNAPTIWNTVKYHVKPVTEENADKIYDVRFVLRFLYSILYPASPINCKLFVEQNCLALLFSCTSSNDSEVRCIAYACLQRFVNLMQELKMEVFAEKSLIAYLIRLFKHSFEKSVPRVSSIISHFFARVSKLMLTPKDPVYPQVMAFLCMKPIFDIENVPEFYKLLFSSSPEHHCAEREWVLLLISEAMLEPIDYQILQNRAGVKLLLTTFASNFVDRKSRALILKTLQSAVTLTSVAHDLFSGEGLHVWITTVINSKRYSRWEKNYLAQIFCILLESERKYQRSQKGKSDRLNATMITANICSKKILQVLENIRNDETFASEQEKANESLKRLQNVLGQKWKMKKKYRTTSE